MGKRYGRNQKRKHREEINNQRKQIQSLTARVMDKTKKEQYADEISRELRRIFGEYFYGLQDNKEIHQSCISHDRTVVVRKWPSLSMGGFESLTSDVPTKELAAIHHYLYMLDGEMEHCGYSNNMLVKVYLGEDRYNYAVSKEALASGGDYLKEKIARNIVDIIFKRHEVNRSKVSGGLNANPAR